MARYGYEPEGLVKAVWSGTGAMVQNDGARSNETVFWERFIALYGERACRDKALFQEFYEKEFLQAKDLCKPNPEAAEAVGKIKAAGLRTALATNPVFPAVATENRIRWAGLEPDDFELYTTYENIGFCKPNPEYYAEVLRSLHVMPEECLMVGNDVTEDMVAQTLGIRVFLLTDCVINKDQKDISLYPHGGFRQFLEHMGTILGKTL